MQEIKRSTFLRNTTGRLVNYEKFRGCSWEQHKRVLLKGTRENGISLSYVDTEGETYKEHIYFQIQYYYRVSKSKYIVIRDRNEYFEITILNA
ncbi:hypothetical protein I3700191H1_13710 [Megasphaera massiliensis]